MLSTIGDVTFIWQETDGFVTIQRIFASHTTVTIPECIEGFFVSDISAYCFAQNQPAGISDLWQEERKEADKDKTKREFCGNFVEEVHLPDSVTSIGNNAFYNCRELKYLSIGKNTIHIGSDIFMNCRNFHRIDIRCHSNETSGLKQILSRYAGTLKVHFLNEGGETELIVVYPEYSESYDEIAPAHIFGRNITGEGFRARQCFSNGVINLTQYDEIFEKASVEENVDTLYHMVLGRLLYPVFLLESRKRAYEDYLVKYQEDIIRLLIHDRDLTTLHYLCKNHYTDAKTVEKGANFATISDWGEGAASLIKWKHVYYADAKKKRFEF